MRIVLVALLLLSSAAHASDADEIRAACLDYIEGWYTADAARMEKALHPDLAKRIVLRTTRVATSWVR